MSDATIRGKLPAALGNATSDAIHAAVSRGMDLDEACCIVAQVAADYARAEYGAAYLDQLADIVKKRATMPLPGSAA